MIVSHKHRFIFLKTRKAAGTSIEVALSQIAGDDAIVTPVHPPEEGHHPRNFQGTEKLEERPNVSWDRFLQDTKENHNYGPYERYMPYLAYFSHMPAWMVRAKLGDRIWSGYFKLCTERNPWDKIASLYRWLHRDEEDPLAFDEWLFSDRRVFSDWHLYSLGGECAVDTVIPYEDLKTSFEGFLWKIGIDGSVRLPHAKSGARRHDCLYSASAVEHVGQVFHREVETFGYECPTELLVEAA